MPRGRSYVGYQDASGFNIDAHMVTRKRLRARSFVCTVCGVNADIYFPEMHVASDKHRRAIVVANLRKSGKLEYH